MSGVAVVIGGIAGGALGGLVIKKWNLSARSMIKLEMISSLIICIMMSACLMHCDSIDFVGINVDYDLKE